jgi:hypothetical protein
MKAMMQLSVVLIVAAMCGLFSGASGGGPYPDGFPVVLQVGYDAIYGNIIAYYQHNCVLDLFTFYKHDGAYDYVGFVLYCPGGTTKESFAPQGVAPG